HVQLEEKCDECDECETCEECEECDRCPPPAPPPPALLAPGETVAESVWKRSCPRISPCGYFSVPRFTYMPSRSSDMICDWVRMTNPVAGEAPRPRICATRGPTLPGFPVCSTTATGGVDRCANVSRHRSVFPRNVAVSRPVAPRPGR